MKQYIWYIYNHTKYFKKNKYIRLTCFPVCSGFLILLTRYINSRFRFVTSFHVLIPHFYYTLSQINFILWFLNKSTFTCTTSSHQTCIQWMKISISSYGYQSSFLKTPWDRPRAKTLYAVFHEKWMVRFSCPAKSDVRKKLRNETVLPFVTFDIMSI